MYASRKLCKIRLKMLPSGEIFNTIDTQEFHCLALLRSEKVLGFNIMKFRTNTQNIMNIV